MIINMNGAKAPETPSPVLQEKTVTPETLPVVIGADEGYDGLSQVTVNPDSQLKAENIRSGKTIFGVTGAFVGEPYPVADEEVQFFYDVITKAPSATPPTQPIRATKLRGEQQFMGATINAGTLDLSNITFSSTYRLFGWTTLKCELILPSFKSESQIFTNSVLKWFPKGNIDYSSATSAFASATLTDDDVALTSEMFPNGKIPQYFIESLGRNFNNDRTLNITIPENITDMSLPGCVGFSSSNRYVTNVIMKPIAPPTLSSNSFKYNSPSPYNGKLNIIVPKGSLEAYQTADFWSYYADIIVEATE